MSLFIFIKKEVITMSFEDNTGNCTVTIKSPIFDTLDSYLVEEKTDEIRNDFWNQFEQKKLITRG